MRRLLHTLFVGAAIVLPTAAPDESDQPEQGCAQLTETTCAQAQVQFATPQVQVPFVTQPPEPVKIHFNWFQRFRIARGRRPYILVQP